MPGITIFLLHPFLLTPHKPATCFYLLIYTNTDLMLHRVGLWWPSIWSYIALKYLIIACLIFFSHSRSSQGLRKGTKYLVLCFDVQPNNRRGKALVSNKASVNRHKLFQSLYSYLFRLLNNWSKISEETKRRQGSL